MFASGKRVVSGESEAKVLNRHSCNFKVIIKLKILFVEAACYGKWTAVSRYSKKKAFSS